MGILGMYYRLVKKKMPKVYPNDSVLMFAELKFPTKIKIPHVEERYYGCPSKRENVVMFLH